MPTTRGMNFFLEDPNLQFLCEAVMGAEVFERARPHLIAMGEVAGGELDALAAVADRNPPVLRACDERAAAWTRSSAIPAYQAHGGASPSSASAWPPCRTARACSAGPAACRTS